ncbi:MAG TPA: hypothetical protein PKZ08_00325 [Vicinamibacterales bacterium]|nr:hypothetical protein [Vicinamibacterales bacterium]
MGGTMRRRNAPGRHPVRGRAAAAAGRVRRAPAPPAAPPASGWRRCAVVFGAVVLVAAGAWAYSTSFAGVLVFDDVISITSNPHVRSLWPLSQAASAPRDTGLAGRPVAALSFAINYALAPSDVRDALAAPGPASSPEERARFLRNIRGYHALNLAVHLAAGLLLFGVARRSFAAPALRARVGESATLLAFAVALVWIVHPLATGAVTYIVQRVESMMGLFYLATLYCAIRAAGPGPLRAVWAAASVAACALGMGSKEAMVTAPVMVALWDLLIGAGRTTAGRVEPAADVLRRRRALYAGLAATWALLAALVAGSPRSGSVGFGLGGWTWWSYLQTQAGVVAHYLRLAAVPAPLVFDYEWAKAPSFSAVAPQALVLAALLAATVTAGVRRHPAGFVGAWFFLILAPSSSVLPIPTEVAGEHRMYLPLAAVIALAAVAARAAAGRAFGAGASLRGRLTRVQHAPGGARPPGRISAADASTLAAALAVALLFGTMTRARNLDYHSTEALMGDTVAKRPLNLRARVAYGAELLASGRFADAERALAAAAELRGSDMARAQANLHLGSALCAQGKLAEGIARLEHALALDAGLAEAHALLGEAHAARGDVERAGAHFALAAERLPDNPAVLRRVAWQLATARDDRFRDGVKAVELAERAARLTARRDPLALEALMAAYAEQGRFAEAAAAGREAVAVARAQGHDALAKGFQLELAMCEAGQRLREHR